MNVFWSCFLFCISFIAYANDDSSMNVNLNASSFVVTLPANPTTGYQWSVVSFDKNLLTLNKSFFEQPKTNLVGAGGQMHFTFTLLRGKKYPEHSDIVFKYARSWEPGSATIKHVTIHFVAS